MRLTVQHKIHHWVLSMQSLAEALVNLAKRKLRRLDADEK